VSGPNADESLIDLVGSIDDDRPVDWDAAERGAQSDEDRATIRELKILSDIARVYRDPDGVFDPADPPAARTRHKPSRTWGPLGVLDEIGRGAFSTIHRAVDKLDREVALKVLSLGPGAGDDDRTRIIREGRLLAKLGHKNIVTVFGIDEVEGEVGLWMELIRGTNLEQDLGARGPMSAHEVTGIAIDLCHALAAIHGAGLLHRDLKAQNVMRESGGRTVLMDFGAGIDLARDREARSRAVAGTPLYLAPELFEHGSPTVASDIYSLGVLIFHMVTGRFPVEGKSFDDLAAAHERGRRHRLRDLRADLPEPFVRVVERAIAPRPADRYRSAGELEAALTSRHAEPAPTPFTWSWRLVAGAAAVSIAGVGIWLANRERPSPPPPVTAATVSPPPLPASPTAITPSYDIEAAFLRYTPRGDAPLSHDERISPGDELLLTLRASRPVFAYVYNEDAAGHRFALYPLEDADFARPLEAGRVHRLPGLHDGEERRWEVSSRGTREHFVVAVSLERDTTMEAWLKSLARAAENAPLDQPPQVGTLRGAGGLTSRKPRADALLPSPFENPAPLVKGPETVSGRWVRQLVLANP
jgi:serine/threonine-protein kinase